MVTPASVRAAAAPVAAKGPFAMWSLDRAAACDSRQGLLAYLPPPGRERGPLGAMTSDPRSIPPNRLPN